MARNPIGPHVSCLAIGMLAALLFATSTQARPVTNENDPAFANAHVVDLKAIVPLGVTEFTFTDNGVTFTLRQAPGERLRFDSTRGVVSFREPGVLVIASPAVAALGFVGNCIDGCPGATFVGTSSNEIVEINGAFGRPSFFGAADIGGIATVRLFRRFNFYDVTHLYHSGGVATPGSADLSIEKLNDAGGAPAVTGRLGNNEPAFFSVDTVNSGPDAAADAVMVDFLPPDVVTNVFGATQVDLGTGVATWNRPTLGSGTTIAGTVAVRTPPTRGQWSCNDRILNVGIVSSGTADPDPTDNVATSAIYFDQRTAESFEICGNGIDDNCNGRTDCADSACDCRPTLPPLPGGSDSDCSVTILEGMDGEPPLVVESCVPRENDADNHGCTVPRGRCGGVTVPAYCCDASTWSDPSNNGSAALAACNVGVPGCAPLDPNFKESEPTVNIAGYGVTDAGRRMHYTIHYENIGNADALDVKVIDVLVPELDDTTLTINDGGVYDAASRTIVWTDPVVPPATPRSVDFHVDVRASAVPGTRVRNSATIVFPNAEPPSRIDTNFVEHIVRDPTNPISPRLRVMACEPAGTDQWTVKLVNEGSDFAYNVVATLVDTSAAVRASQPTARFAHKDDENPAAFATVVPNAFTRSQSPIAFTTQTQTDPCPALTFAIRYENLQGVEVLENVQSAPDRDDDAVADAVDNCPDRFNPDQRDSDSDGAGDACDAPPVVRCDVNADGSIDRRDIALITAARNKPAAGADDPRDADRNGTINVLDARQCTRSCTAARCAIP